MLISIFLLFCSVVQRSITVSPTKKVKAAHPHTQQGDFQPHGALKSDSKHKTQRLGKDKGVISSILSTTFSLTVYGQRKFMFHHKNTLASLICQCKKVWIFTSSIQSYVF